MPYNKPFAEEINTTEKCDYGCDQIAKYRFRKGKLCCSTHQNSCPAKRATFSQTADHTSNAQKSLATRTRLGITKTSQIKGKATRKKNGHYQKLASKMKQHWAEHPWNNNTRCPISSYKDTPLVYQGTYEFEFLEQLEEENGIDWVIENVSRGPNIWYRDPSDAPKLYMSDFLIGNTIYEIKSAWTWNKLGKDADLEEQNKSKLTECVKQGYNVILVLDHKRISYEEIMGRGV